MTLTLEDGLLGIPLDPSDPETPPTTFSITGDFSKCTFSEIGEGYEESGSFDGEIQSVFPESELDLCRCE